MDKEYFLNAVIPPTWKSMSSFPELNCLSEQSSDCFLNCDKSTEQYGSFESAMSSMVSSPVASNSAMSNDVFAIRELIGKLGNICNSTTQISHNSCYTTPLNSPPKLHLPPKLANSMPMNHNLPSLSADPGFAERAAKFSCFGSRSFNGRTSQLGLNNGELPYRLSPVMASVKLPRVSSSPSIKAAVSPVGAQENKNSTQTQMEMRSSIGSDTKFKKVLESATLDRTEFASSNEGSSVSEQIPNGETMLKNPISSNSRKRKAGSRGKSNSVDATKVAEAEDDPSTKRFKSNEGSGSANDNVKTGDEDEKQTKANQKPPEPPKDYIHVRARRGQATDSHSLAERVRREKISERMKLLQDLVPGCNKVNGKALMLDEIINYVQSLQRQVEFLSMKLASVNPRLEFNMDSLLSKDVFQPNGSFPHQTYPLDSSASAFFGQQTQEFPLVHTNLSNGNHTSTTLCQNIGMQLPPVDEFGQGLPQFPTLCEDDLQSIVQMGFGQEPKPQYRTSIIPHEN
ncbi:hypothetical protein ACSBR1_002019 [Camellia fascicularis]